MQAFAARMNVRAARMSVRRVRLLRLGVPADDAAVLLLVGRRTARPSGFLLHIAAGRRAKGRLSENGPSGPGMKRLTRYPMKVENGAAGFLCVTRHDPAALSLDDGEGELNDGLRRKDRRWSKAARTRRWP